MKRLVVLFLSACMLFSAAPAKSASPDETVYFSQGDESLAGYTITNHEWEGMSDQDKLSFISQGIQEIECTRGVEVDGAEPERVLRLMEAPISIINKLNPDARQSMFVFLNEILDAKGWISTEK